MECRSVLRRVKLPFAPGLEVEFTDRVKGIEQVFEWVERGTWQPVVVFGPEGCGKTSLLLQAVEILREQGYSVIYFNPLRRRFEVEVSVESIKQRILERLRQVSTEFEFVKLIWLVIDVALEVLKHGRKRLAIIVDDAFQFMGVKEAAALIKGLLELTEHPEEEYERIVAIAATSEGLSRTEIGRHRWAEIRAMWNMSREGFEELYKELRRRASNNMPGFDDVWRLIGGNPSLLSQLYQAKWNADTVIHALIEDKGITSSFINRWRNWLEEAVRDPDTLWAPDTPQELINELVEKNLIIYNMHSRLEYRWIDTPPPERDLELGIGRYVAWQTPLHREAVRRVLEESKAIK
jgi:energy-coupling factor transporter ATP-binding protein EcfA2